MPNSFGRTPTLHRDSTFRHDSFARPIQCASALATACLFCAVHSLSAQEPDRTVLPLAPPPFRGTIGTTYKESTPYAIPPVTAPAGAPNVLVVLLDDEGYGQSGAFGGLIPTPTQDRLAKMRPALYAISRHRALFSHPRRIAYRAQQSRCRRGCYYEFSHRLSRLYRLHSKKRGAGLGSASRERLCHRGLRQVASDSGEGEHALRPLRPLANSPGLRLLLWLSQRRHQPVVPGTNSGHAACGDGCSSRPQR